MGVDKVKREIDSLPNNDVLEVFRFLSDRVVAIAGGEIMSEQIEQRVINVKTLMAYMAENQRMG